MSNTLGKKPSGDFVDVFQILALLWNRKWLISILTVSVAVFAAVLSLFLPNIYRAEALVAPKTSSDMSDIGRMLSSNIGFASLAGLTQNSFASEETELAIATLKSKAFIWHFIKSRDLLVPLMATKSWDTASDSLVIDDSIYDTESKVWVRDVAPPRSSEPGQLEAYEAFRSILNIERNKITGLVTISIEFYSPKEAHQWVTWLVRDLNDWIMQKDIAEARSSIEYLKKQIDETSLAGLQNVIFNLIEDQTRIMVLAETSDEYFFKTIDPAVRPEEKYRPFRTLIVLVAAFLAGVLAVFWVILRHSYAATNKAS